MSSPIIRKMLESIEFFDELSPDEKDALCDSGEWIREYKENVSLIEEGDPEQDLYVLIDGKAGVFKKGHDAPVAELAAGAVFGEISFFSRKRRASSVRTLADCFIFKLSETDFVAMPCPLQKKLTFQMLKLLIGRLEKMNEVMTKIQQLKLKAAQEKN